MVAPSGAQIFVIHLPKVDGVVWRVPLHYEEVDTKLDQWTQRTKGALGLARPVKTWMVTNTPDMLGVSVHTMEPTGASRLGQETNQAP
jgi:hypothetical protein